MGKDIFLEMFSSAKKAGDIIKEKGLIQISDEQELSTVVDKVIEENPQAIKDFREGKENALGFLMGQVMRFTKGKANPQVVNRALRERLKKD